MKGHPRFVFLLIAHIFFFSLQDKSVFSVENKKIPSLHSEAADQLDFDLKVDANEKFGVNKRTHGI
jgi:hypothetical protein